MTDSPIPSTEADGFLEDLDVTEPSTTPATKRRWPWIVAAATLVAALVIGGGIWLSSGSTFTVKGSLSVSDTSNVLDALNPSYVFPAAGSFCSTGAGMDDIEGGAQVVITGSGGDTLAVGVLEDGRSDGGDHGQLISIQHCVFTFTVTSVPTGKGPYSVEVAHRGKIVFTEAQAADLSLTLG